LLVFEVFDEPLSEVKILNQKFVKSDDFCEFSLVIFDLYSFPQKDDF